MEKIIVKFHEKPELNDPILIEGLPGVGNVGKLAADHMVDVLGAKPLATIYSKHLPPQVLINEEGVIRLVSNKLHYYKHPEGNDLVILTGDYQGMNPDGQYDLSYEVLDILNEHGLKGVYTLGGYSVGKMIDTPKVLGAATTLEYVEKMKEVGVEFSKNEPGNGIVGASGIILGLSQMMGIPGVCLMGETYGYFGDPNGAKAVLEILMKILEIDIDFSSLVEKAQEVELLTKKLKELEAVNEAKEEGTEHLGYIG